MQRGAERYARARMYVHACVLADESPRGHPPVGRPRCALSLLSAQRCCVGITFHVGLTYRKLVYVFCNCRTTAASHPGDGGGDPPRRHATPENGPGNVLERQRAPFNRLKTETTTRSNAIEVLPFFFPPSTYVTIRE